mmetsp:Transcript_84851/g.150252  ORF Transcript_84851/g.150252 Transcript_84851/m.150252 type:complete len:257 (+) Transcript_84851:125-895(+)
MATFWDDLVAKTDMLMSAQSWDHAIQVMNQPVHGASQRSLPDFYSAPAQSVDQRALNTDDFSTGREPFCSMLMVTDSAGLTLKMNFEILPTTQQDCADILKSPEDELFMKLFFSEGGSSSAQNGILIESSHGFPIAFINTSEIHGKEQPGLVGIVRPDTSSVEPLPAPYAYADRTSGTVVHIRYKKPDGALMLTVRIDMSARNANVTDEKGVLLATLNTGKGGQGSLIRITDGMDAALALSAIIAAFKLSDFVTAR